LLRLREQFVPAVLALLFLLSVLQLLDVFEVWYYPMIHRWLYSLNFSLGFSLVPVLLPASFVVIVLLLRWQRYLEVFLSSSASFVINYFFGLEAAVACFSFFLVLLALRCFVGVGGFFFWLFVFLTGLEAASLSHWLLFLPLGLKTPLESVAELEMSLFYVASNLAPYLVLTLIFVCFLKPFNRLFVRMKLTFERLEEQKSSIFSSRAPFFLFIIFFSVLAAIYPYLPNVNPTGRDIGVDIRNYLESAELIENDPSQILKVRYGQRPLIHLVIFVFQKLLNLDALTVIRFLPVLLVPLMALTVYFFAKAFFNDNGIAEWASFFTVFGFPVAVGMFSYYLSNMLGLCLVFSSLGFLFRAVKGGSRVGLVLAFLFGGLVLFAHPWTFDQYFAPLILIIFILPQIFDSELTGFKISRNILSRARYIIFFFLVLLFVIELLKRNVFQGYGGIAALNTVFRSFTSLQEFWYDLEYPLKERFGGLIFSIVSMGLALIGVLALKLRDVSEFYLWILMVATSALFLISGGVVKSRLYYNIPIGVLAALGYVTILNVISSDELKLSFSSFISLSMIVYLFRSLANIILQ